MRLIHRCHGCCCWHRLRLCSQDDCAEEDGRGDRRGRHANIRGREEVGQYNPICPCACRQLSKALLYADAAPHVVIAAGPLHVLHVVLNLIVASFGGGGGRRQRRHTGVGGGSRQTMAKEEEKERRKEGKESIHNTYIYIPHQNNLLVHPPSKLATVATVDLLPLLSSPPRRPCWTRNPARCDGSLPSL